MALTPFSRIRHVGDLALHLGCSPEELLHFANTRPQRQFYDQLIIPKRRRRNKVRIVYRANEESLARMHKTLAGELAPQEGEHFDECIQGFVRGRSIVTNAQKHLGCKVLLHADIQNFFESITLAQVTSVFETLGCNSGVAALLGKLCTLDGYLPQGAHASPALANRVCLHLDTDLKQLAARHGCVYTRYADDIAFSGDEVPEPQRVEAILNKHRFKLRAEKCRIQRRGHSQFVTGLSVADAEGPRYSRQAKRWLRLVLHYASRYGLENHLERTGRGGANPKLAYAELEGMVRFLHSVEPRTAERMNPLLAEIGFRLHADAREEAHEGEDEDGEP